MKAPSLLDLDDSEDDILKFERRLLIQRLPARLLFPVLLVKLILLVRQSTGHPNCRVLTAFSAVSASVRRGPASNH